MQAVVENLLRDYEHRSGSIVSLSADQEEALTADISSPQAIQAGIDIFENLKADTVNSGPRPGSSWIQSQCQWKASVVVLAVMICIPPGTLVLDLWLSVLFMRSKAWLAARVSLRLACLPRTASSAQRSRRLRSTCAAAPVLLAHANVTENINIFSMGPK
jgi:hypothetical protein